MILIGAGGHCHSVIDAAESIGLTIKGVLDRPGGDVREVMGYPVIGDDGLIESLAEEYQFLVSIGFITDSSVRSRIFNTLRLCNASQATVIASTARVSPHARVGEGTVIMHHVSVNAGAVIGEGCIINTGANIEHDVTIGSGTHISTGVMVNGGCSIGERVFVGSGTVIANGVSIADDAIIGAGSVVLHDIENNQKRFGVI